MKLINNDKQNWTVVLDEGDVLEVSSLQRNKEKVLIHCLNASLHIDELSTQDIKERSEEKKAIEVMEKFLNKKKTE